ncbi:OmpH family outer membrane protein [bacterium]|nr:OmpH family outer membrane protein [bacterium]
MRWGTNTGRRRKVLHVTTVLASFLCLFQFVWLREASAEKVYVVDIQQVVAKSNAGTAVRKRVEKEAVKRKAKIERLKLEVEEFEKKLAKQASLLSQAALLEKKDALFQRKKDLSRTVQDEQEFLKRESAKAVTGLVKKIQELLPELVEKRGADVIMERDPKVVVYVADEFDLTDEVVELLNERSISF